MTEIPPTAIEAAAEAMLDGSFGRLPTHSPHDRARCILEASGLPTQLQAALERAGAAETDRDGLWRSLTEGDDHDPRCEGQCGPCGGCGGVEMMRCLTCGGSGECGGCSQAYLLGRERTRRRLLEEIELPRLTTERDQLASQLQEARKLVGRLRAALVGHESSCARVNRMGFPLADYDCLMVDSERFLSETQQMVTGSFELFVDELAGITVKTSFMAPRDRFFIARDPGLFATSSPVIFHHPWLSLTTGEYRPPFWTRCDLGVREVERDRRRYGQT